MPTLNKLMGIALWTRGFKARFPREVAVHAVLLWPAWSTGFAGLLLDFSRKTRWGNRFDMCVKKLHHSVNRKICICFTVYVVFGFRIHCGVLGHENHDFPPDRHLEALYKNLTNSEFLHPENLSKLLDDLNIIPLQHGHNDHEEHNHAEIHKEHGEIQKREVSDSWLLVQVLVFLSAYMDEW